MSEGKMYISSEIVQAPVSGNFLLLESVVGC
jgi:expansin (peptidoglycan-binding protein)